MTTTWRWTWLALVSALVLIAGALGYMGVTPDSFTGNVLLILFVLLILGIVNLAMFEMRILEEDNLQERLQRDSFGR